MMNSLSWIDDALDDLERRGLRRRLQQRRSPQGVRILHGSQTLINFSSNDYLGLAAGSLNRAAIDAIHDSGWGAAASPLITGRGHYHAQLERQLADFEGTESALLFTSGYAANVGAITSLVGKGDRVFSDEMNHASIIDGCRLSGARILVYPHADLKTLGDQLARDPGAQRRLIVTDGLFSMDGDLAPLTGLVELAEKHQAMLMVDEAHATGVFGDSGRGSCQALGVEDRVPIRVGTLSKAFGSVGGFVAGPRTLIEWLANRARHYVFSTALPEAAAAASLAALDIVRREVDRRTRLIEQAALLRWRLSEIGWDVAPSVSQIIPVRVGDPQRAVQLSEELRQQGIWVPAIRPPSVGAGRSLLRIGLSCAHDDAMIDELVAALQRLHQP